MDHRALNIRPGLRAALLFVAGIVAASWLDLDPLLLYISLAALVLLCLAAQWIARHDLLASTALQLTVIGLGALCYTLEDRRAASIRIGPAMENEAVFFDGTVDADAQVREGGFQVIVSASTFHRGALIEDQRRRVLVRGSLQRMPDAPAHLVMGSRVRVRGTVQEFPRPRNPGEFDYGRHLDLSDIQGIVAAADSAGITLLAEEEVSLHSAIGSVRRKLAATLNRYHEPRQAAFLRGIILADRGEIPAELRQSFVDTGTVHVLAVSGLHVGIIALALYAALGLLRLPRGILSLTTIAGLAVYALLTGAAPSVVRATVMAGIVLLGLGLERRSDVYNALGVAALIILIVEPRQLFNVGFQLSYAAVLSIVYFYPFLEQLIRKIPEKYEEIRAIDYVLKLFAVSLAAQIGTLPFTAYYFERISLAALGANLIVVPVVGLNVMLGFATIAASFVSGTLAGWYSALNEFLVSTLLGFVAAASRVPYAYFDAADFSPAFPFFYYVGVGALFSLHRPRRLVRFVGAALLGLNVLVFHRVLTPERPTLTVTVIDVGQGDAIFIQFPNGANLLVDAGPKTLGYDAGARIIAPYLKRTGVSRIDAIVASHAHSDHIGGIEHLIRNFEVVRLFEAIPARSRLYQETLESARSRGVHVERLQAGGSILLDSTARIYVLHPVPAQDSTRNLNNGSLVLKVLCGERSFLLMGDAEIEAEEILRRRFGPMLQSDVLKAGHHGSITSSGLSFLKEVRPELAVISVGRNNKFRHPSQEVLARFEQIGAGVGRTDREGAVVVKTDGIRIVKVDWRGEK